MARHIDSVCKLCRREGEKLFLKADRCHTDKCSFESRKYAPGQHGQSRSKLSEYALQLREKQKVKRVYGLMERQFRGTFGRAERIKGITGETLVRLLERRLDNAVYRCGFAGSRKQARLLVMHGHVTVNGRKVTVASYLLKAGDVVAVSERGRKNPSIAESLKTLDRRGVVRWISLDRENLKGTITALPERDDVTVPMNEQLIVELYSK